MKKFLAFVFFLNTVCALLAVHWTDPATDIRWHYDFSRCGTVCVSGEQLTDTYYGTPYWSPAIPQQTYGDLCIPSEMNGYAVTEIRGYAFWCCYNLISADIPQGVTLIDTPAFYYCSNLKNVRIPFPRVS